MHGVHYGRSEEKNQGELGRFLKRNLIKDKKGFEVI